MQSVVIVTTTLPNSMSIEQILQYKNKLIESKFCACAQSNKINSTYIWDGEIISEDEWEISVKTTKNNLEDLISTIENTHPYDIPQITHNLESTTDEYANWVSDQVK